MKKVIYLLRTIFEVVFMLILLFTLSVSVYDYFAGTSFDEEYSFFCEMLYGEILKYDVLMTLVFFAIAIVLGVIEDIKDRKKAKHEY